jgi:hypothetical protein
MSRTVSNKGGEDDDSISLNSTQGSEHDDNLYVVEKILAEEKADDGTMYYLIEWDGYPLEQSTWEPEENITEKKTLQEWADEKMRVVRGHSKPFNQDAFDERVRRYIQAKENRRRRRREKRKRLGIAVDPSESEGEADEPDPEPTFSDSSSEEAIEVVDKPDDDTGLAEVSRARGRLRKTPPTPIVIDDSADDDDKEFSSSEAPPTHPKPKAKSRQRRKSEDIADTASLSEDSLVEDLKEDAARKERRQLDSRQDNEKIKKRKKKRTKAEIEKVFEVRFFNFTLIKMALTQQLQFQKPAILPQQPINDREASPPERRRSVVDAPVKPRTEAASWTGYQGTANRAPAVRPSIPPVRGALASRGSTRGRTGALRGGLSKPISGFTAPAGSVQRKSLSAALLQPKRKNADPEHFKTFSRLRKAELAGRAAADRAVDPSILNLVNPAEYRNPIKIPKASQQLQAGQLSKTDEAIPLPNKPRVSFADDNVMTYVDDQDAREKINAAKAEKEREIFILAQKQLELEAEIESRKSIINAQIAYGPSAGPSRQSQRVPINDITVGEETTFSNPVLDNIGKLQSRSSFVDNKIPNPGHVSNKNTVYLLALLSSFPPTSVLVGELC